MRPPEQLPDLPLVAELGPVEEKEARALFGALVASGGFSAWAGGSERVRRALIFGWITLYCDAFLKERIAMRLHTLMTTGRPRGGGAE